MEEAASASAECDIPVLIVGAGPVGLALALELGWRGVRCLVVEQGDGKVEHPKVMGIGMRTMEFCRHWGVAEEVRDKGYPKDHPRDEYYCTAITGHLLAHQPYPPLSETVPPPGITEKYQICPQTIFDPILLARVKTFPCVTIRNHLRCDGVVQDEGGVTVTLTDTLSGKPEKVRAGYVVSCEGATSSIRKALGIELEGQASLTFSINVLFRSTELARINKFGRGRTFSVFGPEGRWASVYDINGRDLWRLQMHGSNDPTEWEDFDAGAAIRRFAGRDFDFEIISSMDYYQRKLLANRYRQGRVFLCGDSARQLTPQGNFGMNTGLGDAVDLAWKLQGVIEGWGGPGLLDSYQAERRPIGDRNVNAATVNFQRMHEFTVRPEICDETPAGEEARRVASAAIEKTKHRLTQGVQVGYIYEDSPICVADGTPPPADDLRTYRPTTYPGARAPHVWIEDGKSVIDLFWPGFTLLRLGPHAPEAEGFADAARACGLPFAVHAFDLPELTQMYQRCLVLVRPDGHVAWRGDSPPADYRAVIDRVRGMTPPVKGAAA
ncbi:MAG: FAD-dependent monooxygenase [Proteobacteria bacterium]|nr:FAD-dependent monooxygenase [Pseudomonadota bacterium]